MATYAAKLRKTAIANGSIRLNSQGQISGGGVMEPFNAIGGDSVFYVDANRLNDGDGKTWKSAYNSLATGLAAAHTYMSTTTNRAWGHRATVYVCGDDIDETLTKFAEKTDVIGVGSTNQHPRPRLEGTHVLEATTEDTYHGCRFFNIEFYADTAGAMVTLPANQNGICFDNCVFNGNALATHGIVSTSNNDMKITNCTFLGGFTTACIKVSAGATSNVIIRDNMIQGQGIGIDFDCTTSTAIDCWAIDNLIHTVGLPIDSESDTAFLSLAVVGNRMITDVNTGTVTAGYDFVLGMANGNTITGQDECDAVPYVLQT